MNIQDEIAEALEWAGHMMEAAAELFKIIYLHNDATEEMKQSIELWMDEYVNKKKMKVKEMMNEMEDDWKEQNK